MNSVSQLQSGLSLQGASLEKLASTGAAGEAEGGAFKSLILEAIDQVNGMQQAADQAVEQLSTGGEVNTAEVFTAIQKADMSFRMMMQIRNKMLDAYQEIQNIRI